MALSVLLQLLGQQLHRLLVMGLLGYMGRYNHLGLIVHGHWAVVGLDK